MCVCVYVSVCLSVCVCLCVCVYTYVCVCMRMYVCMYMYAYINKYNRIYFYLGLHVCPSCFLFSNSFGPGSLTSAIPLYITMNGILPVTVRLLVFWQDQNPYIFCVIL